MDGDEIGKRWSAVFVFFDPVERENFFKCLGLETSEEDYTQDTLIVNMIEKYEDEDEQKIEEIDTEEDSEGEEYNG